MLTWLKNQFTPKVQAFNPDYSFVVSGVTRWRLRKNISKIPGVVFTRSGEFTFRGIQFRMDDGGDMGGDGLWITAQDELPHPAELRELREHLDQLLAR